MKTLLLVHGPNLNALGKRDASQYGNKTLADIEALVSTEAKKLGYDAKAFQSNHEGALIDFLQKEAGPVRGQPSTAAEHEVHASNGAGSAAGIIINPGALTHYSFALHDAILDTQLPAVEVHLSDIKTREPWRQVSVIAPACIAQISGKKEQGYVEAVQLLHKKLSV